MSRSKLTDFEILSRLGSGSFGTVYKVRRIVDESLYVIKNVRIVELTHKEQSEAINEVQILAQLKSPYVVRYYDSFIEKDCLHIVMEYCNRGDLQVLIKKAKEKNVTCLKEDVIWNIALQVTLGLHYLHKKHILHRDLKAANVFLMKDPAYQNYLVKIGDLGVAKQMDTSTALANTIVGTPYYLSPELCADMPYKDKSDVWAFGVLLYQCCTLQHPFEARNQCALIMKIIEAQVKPPSSSNISAELTNLIMWVLQKDPHHRPSMKEILNEEFIRTKLDNHNFELPADLEELIPTTSLYSKNPPAPTVSVLDTESAMLKEKMTSFHRKVVANENSPIPPAVSRQGSKSRLEPAAAGVSSPGGATNIGLPPPKRTGSMKSSATMSSSQGSEKSGVAGNRVRPGGKKQTSIKALTIHQVKPPTGQSSSSNGGVVASPGPTPRKLSTPRVSLVEPEDAKSVHEPPSPVVVTVDTTSQEKAVPFINEAKIGGSRQSSKSVKDFVIDVPDSLVNEYKAESKETVVRKLSRVGVASRPASYKDIPDIPEEHYAVPNNNRRPSKPINPDFSPPSEQPSVNYDNDPFEEYAGSSSEVSPNAVTRNRLRDDAKRMGGDVEDEVDILKTPFITMGPLKSFRTAPVEESTFVIPITPSHQQDIDSMFRQTDETALSGQMFRESQDLHINEWSPVWTQNRGLVNPALEGRKSVDVTRHVPESIEVNGIANAVSDELDTEDAELYAFQNGNYVLSSDDEQHDEEDDLNSVDNNDDEDEIDAQTAHEIIEQAAEAQLKSLRELINDSKARSIAKFGADLFNKIYDLCAKHMGVQIDEKNVTAEQREMNMGPKASSFMKELEKYVSESGRGIEIAREAVVGIKVLLALESKYDDVRNSHDLNSHASHK